MLIGGLFTDNGMIPQPRPGRGAEQPVIDGEETLRGCVAARFSFLDKDGVKDTQCKKRGFALRNKANTLFQMPAFCHVCVLYICQKKQARTPHQ